MKKRGLKFTKLVIDKESRKSATGFREEQSKTKS